MIIFDIKRYAINDGPGIRTTIFMKGCPLRCAWCHNPESWIALPQKTYKKSKCIGCRSCVDICPQGALQLTPDGIAPVPGVKCTLCGKCIEECPTTALEMCGKHWSMDTLMEEIEKEREVMETGGGGATICGGEPMMQADATLGILKELGRRGFHRTVDTTLYADPEVVRRIADECELMLVDLKHMNDDIHKKFTGVSNVRILDNIRLISSLGKSFFIRIPLIDGVNSDEENIEKTAQFISSLNWKERQVNLLPYHNVARDKHRRIWSDFNCDYPFAVPSEATQKRCMAQFAKYGIKAIIGG